MRAAFRLLVRTALGCGHAIRNILRKLKGFVFETPIRSEQEVFEDLRALCCTPGFIHAMADICFRHNLTIYVDELKPSDMAHLHSPSHLTRTERTTLIGLMMRTPISRACPPRPIIESYAGKAEQLLKELHDTVFQPGASNLVRQVRTGRNIGEVEPGKLLREGIFYGGESAYSFQYRDLALQRYRKDAKWLLDNKGIDLNLAVKLSRLLNEQLNERLLEVGREVMSGLSENHSVLPGFTFSCAELAASMNEPVEAVRSVVGAFALPPDERNSGFNSLDAFNRAYAFPFIQLGEDEFLSLEHYGFPQALYDGPFYWMIEDDAYLQTAAKHRGEFTESFAFERLSRVFGNGNVFQNVELYRSKGRMVGEIDVLVLFGDQAIVVQAKAKKLTIKARKGNDLQLKEDFQKAVQDAVNQGFDCCKALLDPAVKLRCGGRQITLRNRPRKIYPIAVVAEDYPALASQVRHYLQSNSTLQIAAPIVIDVFALDAITEFLASPLRLLSYLKLRAHFGDRFWAGHEFTLLSYHLRCNLWLDENVDLQRLEDDISVPMEAAMTVRREGIPGADTPEGILTLTQGTPFAHLIGQMEYEQNPVAIDVGLLLLELSGRTVKKFNEFLSRILALTAEDGNIHDFTFGLGGQSGGLTVHCSRLGPRKAQEKLLGHCQYRKRSQQARKWFGLAIRQDGSIVTAVKLIDAP